MNVTRDGQITPLPWRATVRRSPYAAGEDPLNEKDACRDRARRRRLRHVGLFPLCFPLLAPAGPLEILAHRMIWSLVVVGVILAGIRRWQWIPELLRQPRRLALLALAATVISVNWGMYIWGVNSGHVMVSLALAFSFGTYGLVKEKAGAW